MKLPRWGLPLIIALLLVIVALVRIRTQPSTEAQTIACADAVLGCAFKHRGQTVQLRFLQSPAPLQAFTMTLHAPGARQVKAEFHMQGMEMGFNRYNFTTDKTGGFTARVTLPVCLSGRRDWKLYLQIDAQSYEIPFSTS